MCETSGNSNQDLTSQTLLSAEGSVVGSHIMVSSLLRQDIWQTIMCVTFSTLFKEKRSKGVIVSSPNPAFLTIMKVLQS